jgi:hypothetical protein
LGSAPRWPLPALRFSVWSWHPIARAFNLKARAILTDNELRFFHQLQRIAPDFYICPQVGFGALLEPAYSKSDQRYEWARLSVAQKRIDFAICNPGDLSVRCIVELDDRTHTSAADQKRDEITAGAGYRTIRVRSGRSFDFTELKAFLVARTA